MGYLPAVSAWIVVTQWSPPSVSPRVFLSPPSSVCLRKCIHPFCSVYLFKPTILRPPLGELSAEVVDVALQRSRNFTTQSIESIWRPLCCLRSTSKCGCCSLGTTTSSSCPSRSQRPQSEMGHVVCIHRCMRNRADFMAEETFKIQKSILLLLN